MIMLFVSGYLISKRKLSYWLAALVGIIPYSLNEGLRFGRGIDYNIYYYVFEDISNGYINRAEILFKLFVNLFNSIGLGWQSFVFFMSSFFIFSVYVFFIRYKECAKYALPLVPLMSMWAENLMKQTLAFSVILIGVYFLLAPKKKWIVIISLFVASLLIHSSMIVFIPLFLFLYKSKGILLSPFLSCCLFLVFIFIGSFGIMDYLFELSFNFATKFIPSLSYLDFDHFSSGGAANNKSVGLSKISFLLVLVYYGSKKTKRIRSHDYIYAYNLYLFGALFYALSYTNELLSRISVMFLLFGVIVFGVSVINARLNYSKSIFSLLLTLLSFNLLRATIQPAFKIPYCFQYVWDKNSSPVLDLSEYKFQASKK